MDAADILQSAVYYWASGGIILVPIACVCFCIWYFFLKARSRIQQFLSVPESMMEESRNILQDKIMKGECMSRIQEFLRQSDNRFLNAACFVTDREYGELPESFDRARIAEARIITRYLSVLKALVVSSPLLGLLGTVLGMITTFNALGAGMSGATGIMASGISRALITTQFGLIVALPGIWIISLLERNTRSIEARFADLRIHCISCLRMRHAV